MESLSVVVWVAPGRRKRKRWMGGILVFVFES